MKNKIIGLILISLVGSASADWVYKKETPTAGELYLTNESTGCANAGRKQAVSVGATGAVIYGCWAESTVAKGKVVVSWKTQGDPVDMMYDVSSMTKNKAVD